MVAFLAEVVVAAHRALVARAHHGVHLAPVALHLVVRRLAVVVLVALWRARRCIVHEPQVIATLRTHPIPVRLSVVPPHIDPALCDVPLHRALAPRASILRVPLPVMPAHHPRTYHHLVHLSPRLLPWRFLQLHHHLPWPVSRHRHHAPVDLKTRERKLVLACAVALCLQHAHVPPSLCVLWRLQRPRGCRPGVRERLVCHVLANRDPRERILRHLQLPAPQRRLVVAARVPQRVRRGDNLHAQVQSEPRVLLVFGVAISGFDIPAHYVLELPIRQCSAVGRRGGDEAEAHRVDPVVAAAVGPDIIEHPLGVKVRFVREGHIALLTIQLLHKMQLLSVSVVPLRLDLAQQELFHRLHRHQRLHLESLAAKVDDSVLSWGPAQLQTDGALERLKPALALPKRGVCVHRKALDAREDGLKLAEERHDRRDTLVGVVGV
mmetsp:Transcript_46571/g.95288  ORF Transcript_46571/g.95288 Transcript_46571/m.95288 type:complete len:436 (-) Transcript_46571:837-2144(-)